MIPLLIVFLSLTALFFAVLYILYRMAFIVRKKDCTSPEVLPTGEQYETIRDDLLALISGATVIPYEEVWVRASDGIRLYGRLYMYDPNAPTEILFHGYRSNAFRDLSGGLQFARKHRLNVLLVDQRAHGNSGGKCLSFGILERHDCLCWIDFVKSRLGADARIILTGLSMGAATVLMASDIVPEQNVIGIIADCGYSSPREIIRLVIGYLHYPLNIAYAGVRLAGKIFGGFDIESCSAIESVRKTNIPIMFIHGEDDRFVPCEMSLSCREACASESFLLTVPCAGHGLSYVVGSRAYDTEVSAFFRHIGAI